MEEEMPSFLSSREEAAYFKQLALEYKEKWKDSQVELQEFQEGSRELESELEAQLVQAEKANKDLRSVNTRLQLERESLQEKLEKIHQDNQRQIGDLQHELSVVKAEREDLTKYIRELEQANDDLERSKRTTVCSLEDFESKLNHAIERNAFLESELDDKETMAMMVQRLKDEARDLRQELLIQQSLGKQENNNNILVLPYLDNDKKVEKIEIDSNKLKAENHKQISSPVRGILTQESIKPLTPSARISALNIVGDLLRKVGALESKLASCRNLVREKPHIFEGSGNSPATTPTNVKQLIKGSPLPSPQEFIPLPV
ncbi:nuclear distribution protein nudE-like 1 [Limulus polyphemus]|uniref:Nuclear distribution protein nudE-like 1 n=1 Tax=Limulus polyphemus TaxID=6850 RepID=A0ABM1BBI5_LIMPO|nr:nuclear distribution protein nudE-like 1 [Limulus polyphemus]